MALLASYIQHGEDAPCSLKFLYFLLVVSLHIWKDMFVFMVGRCFVSTDYCISSGTALGDRYEQDMRKCCPKSCNACPGQTRPPTPVPSPFVAPTQVPSALPTQFPTRQVDVPTTAELFEQCGMTASVTVEAKLSSVARLLQDHSGKLAVHLAAEQSVISLEADLVINSDTTLFLDGRGITVDLGMYRFVLQDTAKLCLFNIFMTDGLHGAIAVGSAGSPVSNATVNVGWAVFRSMKVATMNRMQTWCKSTRSMMLFDAEIGSVLLGHGHPDFQSLSVLGKQCSTWGALSRGNSRGCALFCRQGSAHNMVLLVYRQLGSGRRCSPCERCSGSAGLGVLVHT